MSRGYLEQWIDRTQRESTDAVQVAAFFETSVSSMYTSTRTTISLNSQWSHTVTCVYRRRRWHTDWWVLEWQCLCAVWFDTVSCTDESSQQRDQVTGTTSQVELTRERWTLVGKSHPQVRRSHHSLRSLHRTVLKGISIHSLSWSNPSLAVQLRVFSRPLHRANLKRRKTSSQTVSVKHADMCRTKKTNCLYLHSADRTVLPDSVAWVHHVTLRAIDDLFFHLNSFNVFSRCVDNKNTRHITDHLRYIHLQIENVTREYLDSSDSFIFTGYQLTRTPQDEHSQGLDA